MLTFLTYFVLVINGNRINRFHLFWDTLYLIVHEQFINSYLKVIYTSGFYFFDALLKSRTCLLRSRELFFENQLLEIVCFA